jgi:hypothetical protein
LAHITTGIVALLIGGTRGQVERFPLRKREKQDTGKARQTDAVSLPPIIVAAILISTKPKLF